MRYLPLLAWCGIMAFMPLAGCQTVPNTEQGRANAQLDARDILDRFLKADPTLRQAIQRAPGIVVLPSVVKGGAGLGGAYGRGILYVDGRQKGFCDMTQGTVGFQLGGQEYSELIIFRDPAALEQFTNNEFAVNAQVTAIVASSGAALHADYKTGVAVFTLPVTGLMAEASVGGQRFRYVPMTP